jgi:RecG-like helicase
VNDLGVASAPSAGGVDKGAILVKPIGEVRWREVSTIAGRVRSLRVQPWANVPTLEAVVVDDTGGLLLVFLGRRSVAGLDLGRRLVASGRVGQHRGYLAMLNPWFELQP